MSIAGDSSFLQPSAGVARGEGYWVIVVDALVVVLLSTKVLSSCVSCVCSRKMHGSKLSLWGQGAAPCLVWTVTEARDISRYIKMRLLLLLFIYLFRIVLLCCMHCSPLHPVPVAAVCHGDCSNAATMHSSHAVYSTSALYECSLHCSGIHCRTTG